MTSYDSDVMVMVLGGSPFAATYVAAASGEGLKGYEDVGTGVNDLVGILRLLLLLVWRKADRSFLRRSVGRASLVEVPTEGIDAALQAAPVLGTYDPQALEIATNNQSYNSFDDLITRSLSKLLRLTNGSLTWP